MMEFLHKTKREEGYGREIDVFDARETTSQFQRAE